MRQGLRSPQNQAYYGMSDHQNLQADQENSQ
jgi:hypothetical protein